MQLRFSFVTAGLVLTAVSASAQGPGPDPRVLVRDVVKHVTSRTYQGRNNGPEQTEHFSRRIKLGKDGRISVQNIAGDMTVTVGSGDEASIEAVKRTRGDQGDLAMVRIIVDERAGRVDVRTEGEENRRDRNRRGISVSVDYTLTVPVSAALDLHSVSGTIKVTGVRGLVRAETISGNITAAETPRLEAAKSVSGDVSLTGVATDGDLSAGSISGNVIARGLKARGLDLGSVSGDVAVSDVTCDRLSIKSMSGNVEYSGAILKSGRYEINSHSGNLRLALANPAGFELSANSFSGSIRSDLAMTLSSGDDRDRDRGRRPGMMSRSMRGTFGDGSATVTLRTFSGNIVITKR
jgi:DUF4097 and DUF4098 domain-containing protein YvlB